MLASYIYAFNGFLIVWGQHYQFSMITVYLPLFLFLLEKALNRERFSPSVPLVTTCIVIYSYYTGYMTMILGGLYIIVRLVSNADLSWKKRFRQFFLTCGSMVLGICMGLFSLLPGLALVSNVSSRLDNNVGLLERVLTNIAPYPWRYYPTLILRFFSSNLEGIGNYDIQLPYRGYGNYYEAPSVFFSTLFIVLAVQYLFYLLYSKESRRKKVLQWMIVLFAATALLLMIGSLVFNGLSAPFSRHTFILMPLFALLTAKMTDIIFKENLFSRFGALVTALCSFVIYLLCYKRIAETPSIKLTIILMCLTTLLMILILFIVSRKKSYRKLTPIALYILLFICTGLNIIVDSHMTSRGRSSVSKGEENYFDYLYNSDMESLLQYLNDTDSTFYRLEKTYANASLCMESCAQNYRGIGTYNSTMNRNILEFTDKLIPNMNLVNFSRNTFLHITHDDVFTTLFGIKYVVSMDPDYSNDAYKFVKQFGTLYLYQNRYPASIGRLFTKTVDKDIFESNEELLDNTALLSEVVITDEPDQFSLNAAELATYSKHDLPDYVDYNSSDFSSYLKADAPNIFSWTSNISVPLKSELKDCTEAVTIDFEISCDIPTEINFLTNNGKADTTNYELTMPESNTIYQVSLTVPSDTQVLNCITRYPNVTCTIQNITFSAQSSADKFAEDIGVIVDNPTNDSHLSGSITAETEGLAFFAIPYEAGWDALLDDEPVELIRTDYGFTGFYVKPGSHTFTLTYHAPLLKEGIITSGIFWAVYLLVTVHIRKKTNIPFQ